VTTEEESSNDTKAVAVDAAESPVESGEGTSTTRRFAVDVSRILETCRVRWRAVLLIAITLAAVGLAAGMFFFQYRPDRQIDDAAADQAVRAASDGAAALLSYSSDTLDRDIAHAKTHLTGGFLAYYTKFTESVVAPAVRDKRLVQQAVVLRAAATQIHPRSAVVLVFVNESVTSADKPDPLITPTAVRITLEKVDGTWLISKLDPVG
jgi:Mce-associated membrane protein